MKVKELQPGVITYSVGISACEKAHRWQVAVGLLWEAQEALVEIDVNPDFVKHDLVSSFLQL